MFIIDSSGNTEQVKKHTIKQGKFYKGKVYTCGFCGKQNINKKFCNMNHNKLYIIKNSKG